jgi:muramidase (phage lysozyme)
MTTTGIAYNPDDPTQASFLAALAQGETGGVPVSESMFEGTGGVDLSGQPTDQYGFPEWTGEGSSSAAGTYQFQPGTWDALANTYGLNFQNPSDQSAGAWYLAQQTYSNATGGQSLETALQNGDYQDVQTALTSVWPSVTGNAAAPAGLVGSLETLGSATGSGTNSINDVTTAGAPSGTSTGSTGIISDIENWFLRAGLIGIGGLLVLVALIFLLWKPAKATVQHVRSAI